MACGWGTSFCDSRLEIKGSSRMSVVGSAFTMRKPVVSRSQGPTAKPSTLAAGEVTRTWRGTLLPVQITFSRPKSARLSSINSSSTRVPNSIRTRTALWGSTWLARVSGSFSKIASRGVAMSRPPFLLEADFFYPLNSCRAAVGLTLWTARLF